MPKGERDAGRELRRAEACSDSEEMGNVRIRVVEVS